MRAPACRGRQQVIVWGRRARAHSSNEPPADAPSLSRLPPRNKTGGSLVPYALDESKGWSLSLESLKKSVKEARGGGRCAGGRRRRPAAHPNNARSPAFPSRAALRRSITACSTPPRHTIPSNRLLNHSPPNPNPNGGDDCRAQARAAGKNVRGMVFINPGNPTGQCLSVANLQELIKFAHDEKIVLLAR